MIRFRRTVFAAQMVGTAACLLARWTLDDALRQMAENFMDAARQDARAFRAGWAWLSTLPGAFVRYFLGLPVRFSDWMSSRQWDRWMTVRKGFVVGAVIGFVLAESSLHAITTMAYWSSHPLEPTVSLPPREIFSPIRSDIPAQMAWFFIQYPFVSQSAKLQLKNHHTFIIEDGPRQKVYVVTVGQKFRRVETYVLAQRDQTQIQVYAPGSKRSVTIVKGKVLSDSTITDGNFWMWRAPLWSPLHLKIYGMADLWLDSPFKRYSCAGFVHTFLHEAGVNVPILDAWDIAKQPWMRVTADEMEPGDIITIRALSREHRRMWHHKITHVGVYIGNGKMIHAATSSNARRAWVRIADVNDFRGRIDKILRAPDLQ